MDIFEILLDLDLRKVDQADERFEEEEVGCDERRRMHELEVYVGVDALECLVVGTEDSLEEEDDSDSWLGDEDGGGDVEADKILMKVVAVVVEVGFSLVLVSAPALADYPVLVQVHADGE